MGKGEEVWRRNEAKKQMLKVGDEEDGGARS